MAETYQHERPKVQAVEDGEDEDGKPWRIIDRLLLLMSLVIARRFVLRTTRFAPELREQILDRLEHLIEKYKRPYAD